MTFVVNEFIESLDGVFPLPSTNREAHYAHISGIFKPRHATLRTGPPRMPSVTSQLCYAPDTPATTQPETLIMGDSEPPQKKPAVPSWQLQSNDENVEEATASTSETPNRETVIEQAKKFLEEDEVKDASTDKKVSFLASKGLSSEEIQSLLGVSRNTEATASQPSVSSSEVSLLHYPIALYPNVIRHQTLQ